MPVKPFINIRRAYYGHKYINSSQPMYESGTWRYRIYVTSRRRISCVTADTFF
jgi:hypothetical protein